MQTSPPDLTTYLLQKKPPRVFITSHINSDPDGFCSAAALGEYFQRLLPNSQFSLYFDSLTKLSSKIAKSLDLTYHNTPDQTPNLWIVTDTSNPSQIGSIEKYFSPEIEVIVIDHHGESSSSFKPHPMNYCHSSSSAGELAYELLQPKIQPLNSLEATLILTAIVYDTRRFLLAQPKTMNIVSSLINSGADYTRVIKLLQQEMDLSERMARLKAAQRVEFFQCNGWIIAQTHVSAFEASAARALINLGADVAFGLAMRPNEVRISARASQSFYSSTGIRLDQDILSLIGSIIGGSIGGHPTAAGANGSKNGIEALKTVLAELQRRITEKNLFRQEA